GGIRSRKRAEQDMQGGIFKPAKTASQSGRAGAQKRGLEFSPASRRGAGPLMGWSRSEDTPRPVRPALQTQGGAGAHPAGESIPYIVEAPHERRIQPKAYADNFRYDRISNWTH